MSAALRESREELALDPAKVQILGGLDMPEYSLGNRSRVWAVVVGPRHRVFLCSQGTALIVQGFLHSRPYTAPSVEDASAGRPLPAFPLDSLTPSPDEVSHIIPMPLSYLAQPGRLALHLFRIDARRPYRKVGVGDQVPTDLLPPSRRGSYRGSTIAGLSGAGKHIGEKEDYEAFRAAGMARMRALEVWGLSGWFLNKLAWSVGWMDRPPPLADPED